MTVAERPTVLIVDDKANMLSLMGKVLGPDADVQTALDGQAALDIVEHRPVQVVLCDLKMPKVDGIDVLRACKRLSPSTEVILMTAYATVDTAIAALRLGAYDYLTKPLEPDAVRRVVQRALGQTRATTPGLDSEVLPGVVARSAAMQKLAGRLRELATSETTLLLCGETGTGKERLARAVHQLGPRASHRLVAINCAAIPVELLETELFGSVGGTRPGSAQEGPGAFEAADQSTLFLDEISELPLALQARVTSMLDRRSVHRAGTAEEHPANVRLIAATRRDLSLMVQQRAFEDELWQRLGAAVVEVLPLRERRSDIEPLATCFLQQQARAKAQRISGFTDAALEALMAYDWPANMRELRAAVERACLFGRGELIDVSDLPDAVRSSMNVARDDATLAGLTWIEALQQGRNVTAKRYLEAVLRRFNGQVAEAALQAGIERESFYRLLRRYGVQAELFRRES